VEEKEYSRRGTSNWKVGVTEKSMGKLKNYGKKGSRPPGDLRGYLRGARCVAKEKRFRHNGVTHWGNVEKSVNNFRSLSEQTLRIKRKMGVFQGKNKNKNDEPGSVGGKNTKN